MVANVLLRVKYNKFSDIAAMFPAEASDVLTRAANTYITEAKRRVPVDTGSLKESIRLYDRGPSDIIVRATGGAKGRTYASYVEYGTRRQRAQPFMTPARDLALRQLKTEIDRLARRMAA